METNDAWHSCESLKVSTKAEPLKVLAKADQLKVAATVELLKVAAPVGKHDLMPWKSKSEITLKDHSHHHKKLANRCQHLIVTVQPY